MTREEMIKKIFEKDRFAQYNGIEVVSVGEGGSVIKAKVRDSHLNANDVVHGSMLFSMADFAFGVAANYLHPVTVTSSASITYLAPCAGTEYVVAEAKEVARHRHNCTYTVTIKDDGEKTLCVAQLNGFIKEQ